MIENPLSRPAFPLWLRWFIGATTVLAATILILATVLGIRAGLQQLELRNRQQVGYHLQRAIDLRAQGNLPEAINAYQQVLAIEPDNASALEASEALLLVLSGLDPAFVDSGQATQGTTLVGQGAAAQPDSAASAPLQSASNENELWNRAISAFDTGEWQEAIDRLVEIQQTQPAFQPTLVNARLYNSYLALAADKDRINDQITALQLLEQAIALQPNESAAQEAKSIIETYRSALSLAKTDLAKAVFTLQELYELDSGYRDVRERLQRAHMAYADSLVRGEEWCSAVTQYNAAIEIQVTPGSISKRDKYATFCDDPSIARSVPTASGAVAVAAQSDLEAGTTNRATVGTTEITPVEITSVGTQPTETAPQETASDALSPRTIDGGDGLDDVTPPNGTLLDDTEEAAGQEPDSSASSTPSSAPTGRIIYSSLSADSSRSRILSQPVEGGQPVLLMDNASQPAMRADGVRMAFHNLDDAAIGLSSFDPGSGLQLRFTKFGEDNLPSWSHDGNRLVFASNREGDRLWRIYTVWAEADGAIQNHGFGEAPSWHPGEDRIAFRGCDERGNGCGIWTMTGNGGDRRSVTNIPADTRPAWSPNGQSIAFMSGARHGNSEIYRADVTTGAVTRLTDHPGSDVSPTVSPDGQWVGFLSDRDGTWKFWAVPIAGGEAQVIAALSGVLGNWVEQDMQWAR